jgi:tRNA(Ile)-lysidine synthase
MSLATPNQFNSLALNASLAPIAVAYSGGADSTALLLLCARQFPGQVQALHVHHGLQAAGDDFVAHCQAFCAALGVPLRVLHVNAQGQTGQSPQDAARNARYNALLGAVLEQNKQLTGVNTAQTAIKTIAIAQHADDQVETLLLALSRGAGAPGLAGMPAQWQRGGLNWVRPLLPYGAQEIRQWLAAQGLAARNPGQGQLGQGWVEDPSNASSAYTRNKIRLQLVPALAEVFPHYRETFARTARHMAQASELLRNLAEQDLLATQSPPRIATLQLLTRARQANALRHWLQTAHQATGSEAQMDELLDQIAACTTRGHRIYMKLAQGFVTRSGDVLAYASAAEGKL